MEMKAAFRCAIVPQCVRLWQQTLRLSTCRIDKNPSRDKNQITMFNLFSFPLILSFFSSFLSFDVWHNFFFFHFSPEMKCVANDLLSNLILNAAGLRHLTDWLPLTCTKLLLLVMVKRSTSIFNEKKNICGCARNEKFEILSLNGENIDCEVFYAFRWNFIFYHSRRGSDNCAENEIAALHVLQRRIIEFRKYVHNHWNSRCLWLGCHSVQCALHFANHWENYIISSMISSHYLQFCISAWCIKQLINK